jgi:hypothetical protein
MAETVTLRFRKKTGYPVNVTYAGIVKERLNHQYPDHVKTELVEGDLLVTTDRPGDVRNRFNKTNNFDEIK